MDGEPWDPPPSSGVQASLARGGKKVALADPDWSVLWWLVGIWLAFNAMVPVAFLISMMASNLRRKFGTTRPAEPDRMAAD